MLDETEIQIILKNNLDSKVEKESYESFVRFLVDLVTNVMKEMFKQVNEIQNPPWMRQKALKKQVQSIPKDDASLIQMVNRQVQIAFHHEKKAEKENLIIRWSHKRRDRVDQVLVRELHAEEASWTNYEDEEVQVKDELSTLIMDALVTDTVQAFSKVLLCSQA